MKVLQLVTARQFRGAEIFAAQLSTALVHQAVDVRYVSLYKASGREFVPQELDWNDLEGLKRRFISFSLLRKLRDQAVDFKADLVQANAGDTLKYAVLARVLFRLRYKIVFRNASIISAYLKNPWKRMAQSLLLRQVDFVTSVSEASRRDILSLYPFLKDKIEVINIAVNTKPIESIHESLPNFSHPAFLHVGGFTFEKNHARLIHIFQKFRSVSGTGSLYLAGDGPLRSSIEELVNQLNLRPYIFFLGSRTDVPALLKQSDCLVLPSVIEGMPAVILEAFFCRVPVIAYTVGGIGEVLTGHTGWPVPPGDEAGFLTAMMEVVNKSGEERKQKAHQLTESNFTMEMIVGKFLNVYKSVLSGTS